MSTPTPKTARWNYTIQGLPADVAADIEAQPSIPDLVKAAIVPAINQLNADSGVKLMTWGSLSPGLWESSLKVETVKFAKRVAAPAAPATQPNGAVYSAPATSAPAATAAPATSAPAATPITA
jgi:hypothetical protein